MYYMIELGGLGMLVFQMSMLVKRKKGGGSGTKKMGFWREGGTVVEEGKVGRARLLGKCPKGEASRSQRRQYMVLVSVDVCGTMCMGADEC